MHSSLPPACVGHVLSRLSPGRSLEVGLLCFHQAGMFSGDSALEFYWGRGTQAASFWHVPKFQSPRRKTGALPRPCCASAKAQEPVLSVNGRSPPGVQVSGSGSLASRLSALAVRPSGSLSPHSAVFISPWTIHSDLLPIFLLALCSFFFFLDSSFYIRGLGIL